VIITPDVEEIRESRPEEYQILKEQNIHSMAEAPLYSLYNKSQLIGFVGLDNPSPEKIENTGEPLLSLAYAVSNAYIRAINEQEQQERFRQTIQSLFSANPESLCTFRVNLTENTCQEPHGISQYVLDSLRSDTADGMIGNAANMIPIPEERAEFLKISTGKSCWNFIIPGSRIILSTTGERQKTETDLGAYIRQNAPQSGKR
jgi:hypothetical protein